MRQNLVLLCIPVCLLLSGAGLGKEGSGITVPVAVKARPDKLGLGADGFKEAIHLAENKLVRRGADKREMLVDCQGTRLAGPKGNSVLAPRARATALHWCELHNLVFVSSALHDPQVAQQYFKKGVDDKAADEEEAGVEYESDVGAGTTGWRKADDEVRV